VNLVIARRVIGGHGRTGDESEEEWDNQQTEEQVHEQLRGIVDTAIVTP
jgi:hypothetical protein